MLTEQENDRLSRVGPGTPMGNLLRRYWHPIASVQDIDREEVLPVRILGENLVLYKTTRGELGLIQERCPHRSTSLAYGVPDADGLRCPYHGWMFDAAGNCLDQPYEQTENPESTFRDKIHVDAYPVETLGGLVWAYMGPPDKQPLLPRWEHVARDDVHRRIGITHLPCNWLQCMENSLDPVHFEWLHANVMNYAARRQGKGPVMSPARHRRIAFDEFKYGIYKRRLLEGDDPETSPDWLTGHPILFPNTLDVGGSLQIRVPIDDENTLHIVYWTSEKQPDEPEKIEVYDLPHTRPDGRLITDTIVGTDMLAWVAQGPITPRPLEHLGVSDRGVIIYRNALSEAIDAVDRGEDPPALVRDPADNLPWIELKWEQSAREAFLLPGQKSERDRRRDDAPPAGMFNQPRQAASAHAPRAN
jgi:5,5'-dehydrodivanillate O-demethylase oxygenase subunit